MPRRKLANKNVRKLVRMGGRSLGLTLPIEILRQFKWREKQKVVVKKRGKTIVIADWPAQAKGRAGKPAKKPKSKLKKKK
ncbi:AbrB/MazE/SpoVT family DNA-binding domain-containing protein [Candidatus Falkowbacteria bacterium]|nr:AbrB/MazE/SpoVT family DNA-binding domain-containing protein [Candidatus Falkowbacteria bacterium]